MKIKQFQIDAFTGRVFGGNPAAVCPLKGWRDDNLLQSIAEENSLSETAFFELGIKGVELKVSDLFIPSLPTAFDADGNFYFKVYYK